MSTVNNGPQIVRNGLVLDLDAGNGKSYSTNRFQALGSGTVTANVTFAINGDGTFQRVAYGTVIGGYTVRPNDVVYSYVLGVTGCHYHGNVAPIPAGSYATFSVDYLITGATNIATSYPNGVVLVYENYGGSALGGSTSIANNYQNIWQRVTLINGPTAGVGTQAMFLYPGFCAPGKLADSGTIYFRNPKVEWTNVDTGNSTFSSTSNIGLWYDLSGNGYNGTLNGPTSNVSNKGNLLFDGSDDYVIGNTPSGLNLSQPCTVNVWVYFNNFNVINPRIIEVQDSSYSIQIIRDGASTRLATKNSNFQSGTNSTTWFVPSTSIWYNISVVWDPYASSTTLYLNSVLQSSVGSTPVGAGNQTNKYVIGRRSDFVATTELNGNVAQVSIYNRALSAAEVSQNYQATKSRFGL